jgi:FkbM family methyltransferase
MKNSLTRKIILGQYKIISKFFSGRSNSRIFRVVKLFANSFVALLKSNFAEVQGHKMFLDAKDCLNLSIYGKIEPGVTHLVRQKIKKGDTVLDLGAHIGYYTLIFAELVGETGKVFAFEPIPEFFELLKKNVEINGYENVILEQKAVSNVSGRIIIELDKNINTLSSHDDPSRLIEVEAVRLDDYFERYTKDIDFIKIDIEGAEGYALAGMTNVLARNENIKIVTEYWPLALRKFGPERYLKLLQENHFELFYIESKNGALEPIDILTMRELFDPESREHTNNIYCIKKR